MNNRLLDRSFLALAHPVRRAIVERLAAGPLPVAAAAAGLGVTKPAISRHVRVLEDAALVEREIVGRVHRLHLRPDRLAAAATWIDRHRGPWESKLDVIEQYLAEHPKGGT